MVLDTEGSGRVSYKQFVMAFKEAKTAGHWLEGGLDGEASLHTLLAALAVRGQEQGTHSFRKVAVAMPSQLRTRPSRHREHSVAFGAADVVGLPAAAWRNCPKNARKGEKANPGHGFADLHEES